MRDGPQQVDHSLSPLSTAFFKPESCSIETVMSRERIRKAESSQADGDKKGMGGYESKMRMDDMPIDWVEQVISFLPLVDVYKCKSVCKAWHVAADRVLSDWETLVLEDIEMRAVRAGKNQIFLQNDAKTWIKRLKQLVRLKEIFVFVCFSPNLLAAADDVVHRNAATLTLLHMGSEPLPFDHNHALLFSNLRDLECFSLLDPDEAAACPRLVKLLTRTSVRVLQKLPAETMTHLHILLELENGSHEEIEQLVAALSRLTQLKSLIIMSTFVMNGQEIELHDRSFSRLFTNMKELEEVDIAFPEHSIVNVDAAIETLVHSRFETLVHNCQSMRSITMHNVRMTDAGLYSLSGLRGLQCLSIGNVHSQNDITTEGILSLLRGGSRNVLRDLELRISVMTDLDQIRAEGQLMQHESGLLFSVVSDRSPYDVLHNFGIAIRG